MLNFRRIFLDEAGDKAGGDVTPVVPSVTDKQEHLDEYGYVKTPPEEGKEAKNEPPKEVPKPKEEKLSDIKDPASGYAESAPKEDEIPPPSTPPEPPIELGYELDIKDVPDDEVKKIKDFAKSNNLTKEVAQALVGLKKTEIEEVKKQLVEFETKQKKLIAETKVKWDKELRTDPNFGGEKFAHNILNAEKVLSDFLPETKKALTERKSMLPPYVMRDLAKLAEHLYGTEKLVRGEPVEPEDKDNKKEFDPLDFYRN